MRVTRFLLAAAIGPLLAETALATEVSKQLDVAAPPDEAWAAIGIAKKAAP